MGRIVSVWATWYHLPDPAATAEEFHAMSPGQLLTASTRSKTAADRIAEAEPWMAAAVQELLTSWSSSQAAIRLRLLELAAEQGRSVCLAQVTAARTAADAIEAAQAKARTLDDDAEARAATDPSLSSDVDVVNCPITVFEPESVSWARTALVHELSGQLTGLLTGIDTGLARLTAALHQDPRDGMELLGGARVGIPPKAPGLDAAVDAADRAALAADLASADPYRRLFAADVQAALDSAAAGGDQVSLLLYDPDHPQRQGGAAIGVGSVADADHIALLVPGVANSPGDMTELLAGAQQIRVDAQALAPDEHTAVVVWLGYDIPASWPHDAAPPMLTSVVQDLLLGTNALGAKFGGIALAGFATQLRGMLPDSATLTLVGHSYGSTVVSEAAQFRIPVDDVVLLAAPGAGLDASTADDYAAVSPEHVYALSFDGDPVTQSTTDLLASLVAPMGLPMRGEPFGPDPAAAAFGAQVIDAPSTVPDIQVGNLGGGLPGAIAGLVATKAAGLKQHPMNNYLASAAGIAVAGVVVSRYSSVPTRKGR